MFFSKKSQNSPKTVQNKVWHLLPVWYPPALGFCPIFAVISKDSDERGSDQYFVVAWSDVIIWVVTLSDVLDKTAVAARKLEEFVHTSNRQHFTRLQQEPISISRSTRSQRQSSEKPVHAQVKFQLVSTKACSVSRADQA